MNALEKAKRSETEESGLNDEEDKTERSDPKCFIEIQDSHFPLVPADLKKELVVSERLLSGQTEYAFNGFSGEGGVDLEALLSPLIDAQIPFRGRTYRFEGDGHIPEKFVSMEGDFVSVLWDDWTGELMAKYDPGTKSFDPDGSLNHYLELDSKCLDQLTGSDPEEDTGMRMGG